MPLTTSTNPAPRAACACGSTNFWCVQSLSHEAEIENGNLVLLDTFYTEYHCTGYETAECVRCGESYPFEDFNSDNLFDNL